MDRVTVPSSSDAGGSATPPPEGTEPTRWSRGWPWIELAALLGVVVAAVTLLEIAYAAAPVPPGVDPGDWVTRSGAYVGLPVPPFASFGSAYLYPPLLFPILGSILRISGSPLTTGFIAGGFLLFIFGLSLIYVAFRFLRFTPLRLGFVGACMFSGTLLYMLFWGAYPNFFAFVFLNLSFVYLLAYIRTGETLAGVLLGVSFSLTYLSHSLTFAIAIVTLGVAAVLLLLVMGPRFLWTRIKSRGAIAGASLVIATVVIYSVALKLAQITPPNYLGGNSAALSLDNIGQLFVPLAIGPMFFPVGAAVYLSVAVSLVLVSGVAAALVVAHTLIFRYRRRWITARHTVAVAAVVAALITPVAGTLAGVGTDYPRFVYYLPVPITLLVAVTLDTAVMGRISAAASTDVTAAIGPTYAARRKPSGSALAVGYLSVGIVLALLFANVAAPTTTRVEPGATGTTHSSQFVAAADWLASNPTAGSVLTLEGTARWLEALTDRGVYDAGPTWLDFEPWQIVNSQSTFWALNSRYAATDGSAILSYTPNSTTILSQSPMYSVFDQGVIFPTVRLLPGALNLTVKTPNGTMVISGSSWGTPTMEVNETTGVGTIAYSNPWFQASVVGTLGAPGAATINVTVSPVAGDSLEELNVALASPPADVALMHLPASQSVDVSGSGFSWLSTGSLGQLPAPVTLNTSGEFAPAPTAMALSTFPANVTLTSSFAIPASTPSFTASLSLSTPGTGNPGVSLPLVLDTVEFLQSHDIHFLLISTGITYAPTIDFFESAFDYTTVYANSQWEVLEG